MTAKCSMCHGSGFVTSQTICDCKKLLEPSTGDWKPEAPCLAMVEVFVKEIRGDKAVVFVGNEYPIFVPLSSIRPIGA